MKTTYPPTILPSLLSADMARFADQIALLEDAGCKLFHVDVMDGHFVPNLTFGPPVVQAISRAVKQAELCVHLMITEPERMLEKFITDKVRYLTVHAEACTHLHRTLQHIRELGALPGVALNPSTSPWVVEYALEEAALVLVMSVNPGWGGQKFIEATVSKIEVLADWCSQREKFNYVIEVDGGIGKLNAPKVLAAGARLLVAGNSVYGAPDPAKAYQELCAVAEASI